MSDERLADDGIEFAGDVKSNADVKITDNYIRAKDDGVQFSGEVRDRAVVLIGGHPSRRNNDGNWINAWDDGVSFLDRPTRIGQRRDCPGDRCLPRRSGEAPQDPDADLPRYKIRYNDMPV